MIWILVMMIKTWLFVVMIASKFMILQPMHFSKNLQLAVVDHRVSTVMLVINLDGLMGNLFM